MIFFCIDQHHNAAIAEREYARIHGGQFVLNVLIFIIDNTADPVHFHIISDTQRFQFIADGNAWCLRELRDVFFQHNIVNCFKCGVQLL